MIVCTECRRAQPMRCTMCVAVKTAPAWLDAPDGPGYWWERFITESGDPFTCMREIVEHDGAISARYWTDGAPIDPGSQWQRVAPPREG